MKRSPVVSLVAVFFFILVIMLTLGGATAIYAQGPTPTVSPAKSLPISVLVSTFSRTGDAVGVPDPSPIILNALNALDLPNLKVREFGAYTSAQDARAAGQKAGDALVIWGVPENATLVLHFEMLQRYRFEGVQISDRENRTSNGIQGLPDSAQIAVSADLNDNFIVSFVRGQLYLAVAQDVPARTHLRAAADVLQAFPVADKTKNAALTNEVNFYLSFADSRSGNFDAAVTEFRAVLGNNARPTIRAWTMINAAALDIDRQTYDGALQLLNNAIQIDKTIPLAYVNQGITYRWQQNADKASAAYEAALNLDPKNTYALLNRGWLHYLLSENDAAVTDFTAVLAIDPQFVDAYLDRLIVYQSTQRIPAGLADAQNAIALDPQYVRTRLLRANLYITDGLYSNALDDLNIALQRDPDNALGRDLRGIAYERLDQNDQALAEFTDAIELDPTGSYPYLHRSYIYLKEGKYAQTILDSTQAVELNKAQDPQINDAYWYRGEAYAALARYPDAIRDYQRYITFSPTGRFIDAARTRLTSLKAVLTATPLPSATPTNTPTNTPKPTNTPSNTPTATLNFTATASVLRTQVAATATARHYLVVSATARHILDLTATATNWTQTPVPSNTPTNTVVPTDTPSDTTIPTAAATDAATSASTASS